MKPQLKFSGVKAEIPELTVDDQNWQFEFRPGGWVIATREHQGQIERRRFSYQRFKDRFFAKFVRTGTAGATPSTSGAGSGALHGSASDFYGQRVEPARAGAAGGGFNDFTAQFPGKVRKLLVKEGEVVEAGVPLVMVEAMKMEFAIKSEARGKVKKLLVQEGQQLTPGQKLLDFENDI